MKYFSIDIGQEIGCEGDSALYNSIFVPTDLSNYFIIEENAKVNFCVADVALHLFPALLGLKPNLCFGNTRFIVDIGTKAGENRFIEHLPEVFIGSSIQRIFKKPVYHLHVESLVIHLNNYVLSDDSIG